MIYIGNPLKINYDTFPTKLEILLTTAYANREVIRERMKDLVSTYHPGQTEETKISA